MNAVERGVSRDRLKTPERPGRPQPVFHGMLVTPETLGITPNGKEAIATFNAALLEIPNNKTGQPEVVSVFRVQTDQHVNLHPDGTNYFGVKRVVLDANDKVADSPTTFINARNLLAPEDIAKNPEDMRLGYDSVSHQAYGALTESMPLSLYELHQVKATPVAPGDEGVMTHIPLVATIVGVPQFNPETGSVEGIDFTKTQFAYEKIDGEDRPRMLVGKNAWIEYGENGAKILRYRPEFYEGQTNQTRVRTLFYGGDGYWHRVAEYDGIYPTDNVSELMPEGNSLMKFGLNGRTLTWNDKVFRIDHVASESPADENGKKSAEYGFITVGDTLKPLLSYDEAITLTGGAARVSTDNKKVIYCNGYSVVGDRLIMAVTLFDKSIGIFSYNMDELSQYADGTGATDFLEKTHLHARRGGIA